jgi:hypothetical protein
MNRLLAVAALLSLAACSASETAVTAAAGGASEVQQAKEAPKIEQRIKTQAERALQQGMDNLKAQEEAASR